MKNVKVFAINHKSEIDGVTYSGQFTTKKLSISDVSKVQVRKVQLNGGMHYDEDKPGCGVDYSTDAFNNMLATLDVALVHKPEWWNLNEIYDMELLSLVYREVMSFENSFRRGGSPEPSVSAPVRQEGGGQKGQVSNGPGTYREMVGAEVQAALEP